MTTLSLRNQLQQQIESLPDDLVVEIADFTAFIVTRRRSESNYSEWNLKEWSDFSLSHFFRDTENDLAYQIEDAQEIFPR